MFHRNIRKKLKQVFPDFKIEVEKTSNPEFGDYTAKIYKDDKKEGILKNFSEKEYRIIIDKIKNHRSFRNFLKKEPEFKPPVFINFWISDQEIKNLFSEFIKKGIKFFQKKPEKKETIVIEYSSPNIAKPLGIHHLRSTIIGQALVDILRFYGHKVISLSFPGDWGTQFGILIAGYKKWGDKEKLKKDPIKEMLELYVRFSKAAKENPKLIEEGRKEFRKLEQGDKENKKLWKWFSNESLKDFNRVYDLLGVKIENTIGESYYEPELKSLVRNAFKKGIAKKGKDGAIIVNIVGSSVPEIIQKSDGTTIYTTRELAAIRHRLKKWKAGRIFYVAANQQTFHLSQVFKVAERLGIAKEEQLLHIKFGMMLGPGAKKFATREGRIIPLEDVLKEAIARAKKIVDKLNPSLSEKTKEKIAEKVGIGAIKFYDLSHNRLADIVFDWEKMLNLKGFSAPYIQYTYARLNSILEKAKFKKKRSAKINITHPLEKDVIMMFFRFDEIIQDTAESFSPNRLAEYLYELADILNSFYEKLPVIKEKNSERETRLNIIFGANEILKTGLNLLGISAPTQM